MNEKPDFLSCLDLLISLNKSWDVKKVRQSLDQYRLVGNSMLDANNFGLTFDKFCDIFKVPLYDHVLSKYISEPGYRALLGSDAITFVEEYFKMGRAYASAGATNVSVDDVDHEEAFSETQNQNQLLPEPQPQSGEVEEGECSWAAQDKTG